MKSIKPGRGPSFMGGIESLFGVVFGIVWTAMAASMESPFGFVLIGVVAIIFSIVTAIYNFANATGDNRFSEYDITDSTEEPDPLDKRFSSSVKQSGSGGSPAVYCPYCGCKVGEDYKFCKKCGRELKD